MGYQTSFFSGLSWSGGLKIASKLLSAIKIAIIARLLPVEYFGLFSLVLVALSLVEVFTESGINTIIVQSNKDVKYFLNTAWVVSIVRGFIISVTMVGFGYLMSVFYLKPDLFLLICLAAIVPIIRGFINPSIIEFHKNLSFRQDSIYRFSLIFVEVLSAILLSMIWRSPFVLIAPLIISALFDLWVSYQFTSNTPRFKINPPVLREILNSTKWLNGISVIDYLNKNIDDLILGKVIGTQLLGFYSKGYTVTQSGTAELGTSVIHASFPVYARISGDPERIKRAFYKVFIFSACFLLIPTFIFVLFPQLVVDILLGSKWQPVVYILPLLAVAGYLQALFTIGSTLLTAKKKYLFLVALLAITLCTMLATIIPLALHWGLFGAALSIVISRVVTLPFFMVFIYLTLHTDH